MNKFYKNIEKYGRLLLTNFTEHKPKPTDIGKSVQYGLYWINSVEYFDKLPKFSTVVISETIFEELRNTGFSSYINLIISDNPRKTYANIIHDLYPEILNTPKLKKLEPSDNIGFNVYVSEDVIIGDSVIIGNNVTIYHNIKIGDNVVIGDNCVIGSKGVAFDKEDDDSLTMFPQIGGVIIGDNVELGSFCDIKRGALKNTIISKGVKMGAYNNIGHNVFIGENCFISMRCNVCGSSIIGKGSTLWVNSTIKHKIIIPEESIIGSNTYVDKNFDKIGIILLGIPAKEN